LLLSGLTLMLIKSLKAIISITSCMAIPIKSVATDT
jgi:hypothetical protein